jgi:GNAT superfamily N-acetyltransferase
MRIELATTDEEILACHPVMAELRPQYSSDEFLAKVRRLMAEERFQLAYLSDDGVRSVAGIRMGDWLPTGKYLEIEDLVTAEAARSKGYGQALLRWVCDYAKQNECEIVRLSSATHRVDAHRFYEREGMTKAAWLFARKVRDEV